MFLIYSKTMSKTIQQHIKQSNTKVPFTIIPTTEYNVLMQENMELKKRITGIINSEEKLELLEREHNAIIKVVTNLERRIAIHERELHIIKQKIDI